MPENHSHEQAEELPPSRRKFYILLINGIMGLISAALAIPAAVYLLFPPKVRKASQWVKTADLSTIPAGKPTEISFQRTRADGWQLITEKATAWVVKQPNNDVVAFTPNCTHLGCAFHWDEASHTFLCPCHTSAFAMDGKVLGGPAPRPLDRYEVKIEAGVLEIGPPAPHA
jgi:quinol---cytochrome c reductase iron-sulfur subunit, bacillus type